MHHQHEPIIYSRKSIFKLNKRPLKFLFKAGIAEINKSQEHYNLFYTYCNEYNEIYIIGRLSVTSTSHLFNEIIIYWCSNKQSKILRTISNTGIISMYKGVLDNYCWCFFLFDDFFNVSVVVYLISITIFLLWDITLLLLMCLHLSPSLILSLCLYYMFLILF